MTHCKARPPAETVQSAAQPARLDARPSITTLAPLLPSPTLYRKRLRRSAERRVKVAMSGTLLSELDYDFVVLGTGLVESVLAASLSFSGARVLHLDRNPFYGGHSYVSAYAHRLCADCVPCFCC